jgi:hypothetical protein
MMVFLADSELSRLLLEDPWPVVIAFLAVAAVLRVVGKRQEQPKAVMVSWVALAVSFGVYVTASLVNTDRERLVERTEALVAAAWPVDEAAWRDLLAGDALLLGPDGSVWDELTAEFVTAELQQHRVEETALRAVEATPGRPGYGVSTMDLSSRVGDGFPMRTTWEIVWQQQPDDAWRVLSMKWLSIRNQDPSPNLYR